LNSTDSNDVARHDLPEALEHQQPHGHLLHAVTQRDTHFGIFTGARNMSERERWAYEELQVGDLIQEGDQWQNEDGRWHPLVLTPTSSMEVRDGLRARRPYKVSTILEIGDALANAQNAAMQLQDERDEAQADVQTLSFALKSVQRARDELQLQVDELRAGLMGVVSAEDVHSMLQEMLDETEWVGQCLDASSYEQMSCIQRTISVILQRVSDME
jgi:hypothetical protein